MVPFIDWLDRMTGEMAPGGPIEVWMSFGGLMRVSLLLALFAADWEYFRPVQRFLRACFRQGGTRDGRTASPHDAHLGQASDRRFPGESLPMQCIGKTPAPLCALHARKNRSHTLPTVGYL